MSFRSSAAAGSSENRHLPLLAALLCGVAAVAALRIDLSVARYFLANDLSDEVQRVLNWSEVLAHGTGVAIVALILYVLDPSRRRRIPRLLVGAYGAGLAVNGLKLLVVRYRPHYFDFDLENSVADTFAGWLPLLHPISGFDGLDSGIQSFPSGHAAVAVALAFGLARCYPRGGALFAVLAALAACQRVAAGDHFVSDTLAGAAVGSFIYWSLAQPIGLGRWLARLEAGTRSPTNEDVRFTDERAVDLPFNASEEHDLVDAARHSTGLTDAALSAPAS